MYVKDVLENHPDSIPAGMEYLRLWPYQKIDQLCYKLDEINITDQIRQVI